LKPNFTTLKERVFTQFNTNNEFKLVSSKSINIEDKHITNIQKSCNERLVYKWLFTKRFPQGYTHIDAKEFITRANKGWDQGKFFVFFIISPNDEIVGAMDIKTNTLDSAEIGYWVSENYSGLATNAINELKSIAKEAGFLKLFAQTKSENEKSNELLVRTGFKADRKYLASIEECDQAFVIDL
jgi:RimJ/RimL family protein N-acetyltransferase